MRMNDDPFSLQTYVSHASDVQSYCILTHICCVVCAIIMGYGDYKLMTATPYNLFVKYFCNGFDPKNTIFSCKHDIYYACTILYEISNRSVS